MLRDKRDSKGRFMRGRNYKHTVEAKEKIKIALLGKKHTKEHIEKNKLAHLGQSNPFKGIKNRYSQETIKRMSLAHLGQRTGENNPNWRGDDIGYGHLHKWIRKYKPKSDVCENCGIKTNKPLDAANISGNSYFMEVKINGTTYQFSNPREFCDYFGVRE